MPKTTTVHPLAIVRKELGWTQQKLADKCGVALVTIKKIEGKARLQPGRDLLGRIMWATGVDADSLSGKAPTFMGLPYTGELGKAHVIGCTTRKNGDFQNPEMMAEGVEELFLLMSEVLVLSARKNAYHTIRWSLVEWMADTVIEFGMEKEFAQNPQNQSTARTMLFEALKARKKSKKSKR
ncbi:MAG: helix-turn-helix transcriptional regulator [Luteolibacter sp.]